MLEVETGHKRLAWFDTEYLGSDFRVSDAAKLFMENLEQKAACSYGRKEKGDTPFFLPVTWISP